MLSKKRLIQTIESLERMKDSCTVDGDIDAVYFDELIQNIYDGKQWLNPGLAQRAKVCVDFIELEIRKSLRNLLKEGENLPKLKKAKSAYNSFSKKRPIIGFDRNA